MWLLITQSQLTVHGTIGVICIDQPVSFCLGLDAGSEQIVKLSFVGDRQSVVRNVFFCVCFFEGSDNVLFLIPVYGS